MTRFKVKYFIIFIAVALLLFAIPLPFLFQTSWSTQIIEISSAEELFSMAENFAFLNPEECNYKLIDDIDLEGKVWTGTGLNAFKGEFDGNGHTIKNLILSSDSTGSEQTIAFWTKTENAFIHDVIFENIVVDTTAHNPTLANGVRVTYGR